MSVAALAAATRRRGRGVALRYLALAVALNLLWEVAQLPLYTVWRSAGWATRVFAVAHCTAGDAIILAVTFAAALLVLGGVRWPDERFYPVAVAATAFGLLFTVFSEWLNVDIRGRWAYAAAMPLVPPLGTGLSPLLQWVVIPPLSLLFARKAADRGLHVRRGARRPG